MACFLKLPLSHWHSIPFNLYVHIDSSFWFDTINFGKVISLSRGQRLLFPNDTVFIILKIVFILAKSVDPGEMSL